MDEGAGAVQVCIHLGGEGLVDSVTLSTDGGKFNVITFFLFVNNPGIYESLLQEEEIIQK